MGNTILWKLCKEPESVPENEAHKIIWDFELQTDHVIPEQSKRINKLCRSCRSQSKNLRHRKERKVLGPYQRIFIIKGFRTTVFIFIVISTTFRSICLSAFFRCLSNSGTWRLKVQSWRQSSNGILNTCTWLWLSESEQVTPVDSIKDVVRSSLKVPEFDKHLKNNDNNDTSDCQQKKREPAE